MPASVLRDLLESSYRQSTGPIEPMSITKLGAVEEKNTAKVVWDRDGVQGEGAIFGVGGVAAD
jgi:hypothetical protein